MNKSRQTFAWIGLLALVAVALPLTLSDTTRADDDDHSPLHEYMEMINNNYKLLRREKRRMNFADETPQRLQEMQLGTLKAMHEPVPLVQKAAPARQKEEMIAYKKLLKEQLMTLIDMEIAWDEGDIDALAEGIDKLGGFKSDGHDRFTQE